MSKQVGQRGDWLPEELVRDESPDRSHGYLSAVDKVLYLWSGTCKAEHSTSLMGSKIGVSCKEAAYIGH